MNRTDIQTDLESIFRDIFDEPVLAIQPEMTASDVQGWDSLTHVNLIVAVEKTFGVRFTTAEIGALSNVGDLMNLISRKLAN